MGGPGAGFMFHMINSLKFNNRRAKKPSYFQTRDDYIKAGKKLGLQYRKATRAELAELRALIIADRKRLAQRKVLYLIVTLALLMVTVYAMYHIVFYLFETTPNHFYKG